MDQQDIMGRASLNSNYEHNIRLFVKMNLNDILGKYLFDRNRCVILFLFSFIFYTILSLLFLFFFYYFIPFPDYTSMILNRQRPFF